MRAQVQFDWLNHGYNSSHLCFNVVKSTAMLIGSWQRIPVKPLIFWLGIQLWTKLTLLGICMGVTLSWSLNITSIVSRRLPLCTILLFTSFSFCLTIVDYCVWCPHYCYDAWKSALLICKKISIVVSFQFFICIVEHCRFVQLYIFSSLFINIITFLSS